MSRGLNDWSWKAVQRRLAWWGLDTRKGGPSWKCQRREGSEIGQERLAGVGYAGPVDPGLGSGAPCLFADSPVHSPGRNLENDCDQLITRLDLFSL